MRNINLLNSGLVALFLLIPLAARAQGVVEGATNGAQKGNDAAGPVGAVVGGSYAALYANCDSLAEALLAAGQVSGDRLWRMPLEDGYLTSLKSPVADIAHVARDHNPAGSILAALFLREFVAGIPWAHLDIAGPGRTAADDGERSKGATGFGARVLLRWLAPDPR